MALWRCFGCVAAVAMVPIAIILSVLMEVPVTKPYVPTAEVVKSHIDTNAATNDKLSDVAHSDAARGGGSGGMGSGGMFDRIAWAYDTGNKAMSLGLDQFWRQTMLNDCLQLERGDRVLDLATGTADVAILQGQQLFKLGGAGEGSVLGIDPSIEMLRRGVAKVENSGLPPGFVTLSQGDAQDLSAYTPLDSSGSTLKTVGSLQAGSVDKISISFGIRNVPDRVKALREMRRVLSKRPSSRVCILEFSLPSSDQLLSRVARGFITHGIPMIGKITTFGRGGDEYKYLEESITKFPTPQKFAALMTQEGLSVHNITEFAYGSVQLYHAGV